MSQREHQCFGCQERIKDDEPHIHVPMDDFAKREGLAELGLDDLFTFAFCEACTEKHPDGWQIERHRIRDTVDRRG